MANPAPLVGTHPPAHPVHVPDICSEVAKTKPTLGLSLLRPLQYSCHKTKLRMLAKLGTHPTPLRPCTPTPDSPQQPPPAPPIKPVNFSTLLSVTPYCQAVSTKNRVGEKGTQTVENDIAGFCSLKSRIFSPRDFFGGGIGKWTPHQGFKRHQLF